jgi:hypothetical protein
MNCWWGCCCRSCFPVKWGRRRGSRYWGAKGSLYRSNECPGGWEIMSWVICGMVIVRAA